jgi:hypothetical protein
MAEATSRKIGSLSDAIHRELTVLKSASVVVPHEFRQVAPGQGRLEPGTAPLFIDSEALNATRTTAREAAAYVTTPAMCSELTAEEPPPVTYFAARQLLFTWLLVAQGELSPTSIRDPDTQRWLRLPPSAQDGWIRNTYQKMTACDLDGISIPFGA